MAKAFSVASWNVEHFGNSRKINGKKESPAQIKARIDRVANYIKEVDADVTGIYEVSGSQIFSKFRSIFPNHQFFITEGRQTQEILVMIKPNVTVFITQKIEFKSGGTHLRPGALATVTIDDVNYPVLFLHLKSMPDPKGFGLRDDMLNKAVQFKSKILKSMRHRLKEEQGLSTLPPVSAVPSINYIFLGDLNIMGMNYRGKVNDITSVDEMSNLDKLCQRNSVQMKRLVKTEDLTYRKNASLESDLDHVVASNNLEFKLFDGKHVDVRGWPQKDTNAKRDKWRRDFSDHALLYFEVQKV